MVVFSLLAAKTVGCEFGMSEQANFSRFYQDTLTKFALSPLLRNILQEEHRKIQGLGTTHRP
jgi:hypothetical protein